MNNCKPYLCFDKIWNGQGFEKYAIYSGCKSEIGVFEESFRVRSEERNVALFIFYYRFKVVNSSKFAEGLGRSGFNNKNLGIKTRKGFVNRLLGSDRINTNNKSKAGLELQSIKLLETGVKEKFKIELYKKKCLFNALSEIDYSDSLKDDIEALEIFQKI